MKGVHIRMDLQQTMATYGEECLKIAYVYVNDWTIAEEIVQQVFLAYATQTNFSNDHADLLKMTVTNSRAQLRKRSFRKRSHTKNNGRLYDALQQLPMKYREVLMLTDYAQLDSLAISDILACSVRSVEKRQQRGRQRLKTLLDEFDMEVMRHEEL